MDESWRLPMGRTSPSANAPAPAPRRKSTDDSSRRQSHNESNSLHPEDFDDVFGGPPRSVLSRQFSAGGEVPRQRYFYEDIFRRPERIIPARSGRSLPAFRIPVAGIAGRRSEEFYSDVFGVEFDDFRRCRSRSKSKTNSNSSVSAISDDDGLFVGFASKLRPINVPSKWNTSTLKHQARPREQHKSDFSCSRPSFAEKQFENEHIESIRTTHSGLSRTVTSPESISLGPYSYSSVKVSVEDVELDSPSSAVSSLCQEQDVKANKVQQEVLQEDEEEEDDEVVSSYVIEINSDHKDELDEALGIDEAIAWAKERFCSRTSLEELSMRRCEKESSGEVIERSDVLPFSDERESLHLQGKEMKLLDEDVRLWSSGNERNIQLLLSTLHDILWPSSGWFPVCLVDLNESSDVKKAYQKARLFLHPDKLQQRGATLSQKYVAEMAFPILQEAWAAFITQDIIPSAQ